MRSTDLVARYGGEEFAVILSFTPTTQAVHVAESIRQGVRALEIPHCHSAASGCVTMSVSVASILATPEELPNSLIAVADMALYQATTSGRDCVTLYPLLSELQGYT
jgi:diguanylate cyclase (GGDEF)-like protein